MTISVTVLMVAVAKKIGMNSRRWPSTLSSRAAGSGCRPYPRSRAHATDHAARNISAPSVTLRMPSLAKCEAVHEDDGYLDHDERGVVDEHAGVESLRVRHQVFDGPDMPTQAVVLLWRWKSC